MELRIVANETSYFLAIWLNGICFVSHIESLAKIAELQLYPWQTYLPIAANGSIILFIVGKENPIWKDRKGWTLFHVENKNFVANVRRCSIPIESFFSQKI